MNFINITLLQTNEYSNILSDFYKFKEQIIKIIDRLEQQLKDYIQYYLFNYTYTQKAFELIEKEQFNFEQILDDYYNYVQKEKEQKVDKSVRTYTENQSIALFQTIQKQLYEKTIISFPNSLSSPQGTLLGKHSQLTYKLNILLQAGYSQLIFATFCSIIGVGEQSVLRVNITSAKFIVVGMCERGRLEKSKYKWGYESDGMYAVNSNGYCFNARQMDSQEFECKTGDLICCTYSDKTSVLSILNNSTAKQVQFQLDPNKEYDYCVGLKYSNEHVQVL